MGQLSAATNRSYDVPAEYNHYGVADDVVIYRGSAVGSLAGYARQLVAGDTFLGFAEETVDNTTTGHSAGGKQIQVRRWGQIQLSVASVAVTDIMADVYASDGDTFTLVAGSNSFVGKVHRFISSGVASVAFDTTNPA